MESLGVAIHSRGDDPEIIAELTIRAHGAQELSELVMGARQSGGASIADMRELPGKLRFAQRAGVGRSGRVALRPLHHFLRGERRSCAGEVETHPEVVGGRVTS